MPRMQRPTVKRARRRSRSDVLSGKATLDIVEKKNALRPNAESGKAVADPRWLGQFRAARPQSESEMHH